MKSFVAVGCSDEKTGKASYETARLDLFWEHYYWSLCYQCLETRKPSTLPPPWRMICESIFNLKIEKVLYMFGKLVAFDKQKCWCFAYS